MVFLLTGCTSSPKKILLDPLYPTVNNTSNIQIMNTLSVGVFDHRISYFTVVVKDVEPAVYQPDAHLSLTIESVFKDALIVHGVKIKDNTEELNEDSEDLKDTDKFTINTRLRTHKNSDKFNLLKQIKQEDFDLQTYKKFISFLKFQEMIKDIYN